MILAQSMAAEPLTASVFIKAPPDRVYEYFTQPEAIVRWMGEYAVLKPAPGGSSRSTCAARRYAAST